MALDNFKNFAKSTLASGIDNAVTSLDVAAGTGTKFPTVPFSVVVWNKTDYPDPADDTGVEIMRVTALSTDTLTVKRAQEGTSASAHNTGGKTYGIIAPLTASQLNDAGIEVRNLVFQTSHGLSVGDVIKISGANTYAKAKADVTANADVVGIVITVQTVNMFTFASSGVITTGVPAVAAGTIMYLDASTAGALTSTEPSAAGNVSRRVLVVLQNATKAILLPTVPDTMNLKRINPRTDSTASSATPAINTDIVDCYSITALAAAITSMTSSLTGTPVNFQKLIIRIKDNGTARAITWGASFVAKGVPLPTTTVISKLLTVGFVYDSVAATWGCVASVQEI